MMMMMINDFLGLNDDEEDDKPRQVRMNKSKCGCVSNEILPWFDDITHSLNVKDACSFVVMHDANMFCKDSSYFEHRMMLVIALVNISNTGVVVVIEEEEPLSISFKNDSMQFLIIMALSFSFLLHKNNNTCLII